MNFECLYHQSIPRGSNVLYILFDVSACREINLNSLVKLLIEKENRKQILLRSLRKLTRTMRKLTM